LINVDPGRTVDGTVVDGTVVDGEPTDPDADQRPIRGTIEPPR
jgi:hypothetical protein